MYNEWGSFTNDYWKWMSEQEESMEPAGTCSGTIAMFNSATAHSRIPWDDRDDWQPHQLADCTLKEGATLEQVMEAQARTGELMKEAGFEGWGTHVFTPYLGFDPSWPYDYVQMNHWYTLSTGARQPTTGWHFWRSTPKCKRRPRRLPVANVTVASRVE